MSRKFLRDILINVIISGLLLTVLTTCEKPERIISFITLEALEADISYTTATLKGEIVDAGSQPVDEYGIVYSSDPNPRIGNGMAKSAGTDLKKGEFSITVTGLTKNTKYYFRAYVIIDDSEIHADKINSFTTKDTQMPTVTAGTVKELTMTSASLGGEVTSDGGETNTTRGLCWGSSANPTLASCLDTTINGSGTGAFTGVMTGLSAGTQYYARTYATNSKGPTYSSADVVFKTHSLPSVTTAEVTNITGTGALSGGEVTDEGGVEVTARGVCWDTNTEPTADLTTRTSDDTGEGSFESTVTGLTSGTIYYLRAYVTNQYGTSYGEEKSFIATKAPQVTTDPATIIGKTTATLNGSVNANNAASTVTFEYGTTTSYGTTISATPETVTGNASTTVLANISALDAATTYHYRIKAVNSGGTAYGDDLTFTTLQDPGATTSAATSITTTSAILNGSVNANNSETIVSFQYGTTTTYGSSVTASESPVTGNSSTAVSAALASLTPGTTYHYRVRALSEAGEIFGADQEFTTLKLPSAATLSATTVTGSTATLNGTVNANSSSTTVTFEYGLTTAYGTEIAAAQSPVTGTDNTAVSANLAALTPGTEYHYRVKAVSSAGTAYGEDKTLTTSLTSSASTNAATAVGNTTATLNGTINAAGSSTTVTFEYGTSTSYGSSVTAFQSPVTGTTNTAVSADLTGLTAGTEYHFRVKAVNGGGTTYGSDVTFTTLKPPAATTDAASAVDVTTASLNGTVNANGFSTAVTFEYGLTTAYGNEVTADQSPVTGSTNTAVSKVISGLTASTTYHFRVKAVNSGGTTYGGDVEFTTTTPLPTVSDYEGNTYNIITIGTQEWIQKNLMVTHYSTGDAISNITDNTAWSGLTTDAFCWYNNDETTYGDTYGALYNWYAVSDVRNVCPAGWHVPTDADWAVLTTYLGGINTAGGKLKEAGTTHWASPNEGATNETGFTALPGGNRYYDGAFEHLGSIGDWWSATGTDATMALSRGMYHHTGSVSVDNHDKRIGFSIRCLKGSLPLSATMSATSVLSASVTLNGKVNPNDASTTVTFEYGTTTAYGSTASATPNPVTGTTPVNVSTDLTMLTPATEYHYRVKAVNSGGTSYGSDMTFTTASLPAPAATTGSATAIASTSATLNGTVNANDLSTTVTFEYGLTTGYGTEVTADQSPVTGTSNTAVSKIITGLTASTKYHYRVKAVSAGGTTYGDDDTFSTSAAIVTVTDYEGNIYNTVLIGAQRWMAENLKATKLNDGTLIPIVSDNTSWSNLTTPGYSWLDNDQISNEDIYGALYNWLAVNTGYLCPTGWHVPSDDEFTTLVDFVGGAASGGGTLKETGTEHWLTPNTGATNTTGFTGLPGGVRYDNGIFALENYYGYWWSTTEQSSVNSWYRYLYYNNATVGRTYDNKKRGKSVRCVEGELPFASTKTATAVASTSVTLNGNVYANGASTTVTFEYGTSTSYGSEITASESPVSGTIPVNVSTGLTGLTPATEYHYRVKAVNSGGTSYGSDMTFTTPAQVSDVDGNTYNTVIIGTQTWMQENLKTTKLNDNTSIPNVTTVDWIGLTTLAFCWYENNQATYGIIYGALYNWHAVNTNKLCPSGWHVPSDIDWTTMTNFLGGSSVAGGKLKEAGTSHWISPNTGATNETAFTALPSGDRTSSGANFDALYFGAYWWSSTQYSSDNAYYRDIGFNSASINRYENSKRSGLAVRCLKD